MGQKTHFKDTKVSKMVTAQNAQDLKLLKSLYAEANLTTKQGRKKGKAGRPEHKLDGMGSDTQVITRPAFKFNYSDEDSGNLLLSIEYVDFPHYAKEAGVIWDEEKYGNCFIIFDKWKGEGTPIQVSKQKQLQVGQLLLAGSCAMSLLKELEVLGGAVAYKIIDNININNK